MLFLLIFQPLGLVRVHLGTDIVVLDDSEQGARYVFTSRSTNNVTACILETGIGSQAGVSFKKQAVLCRVRWVLALFCAFLLSYLAVPELGLCPKTYGFLSLLPPQRLGL